jgi:predicted dehydrogenase
VGHLERFNPAVVAVRNQVVRPLFFQCERLSLYQPRGTDVSVVHDLMIHDIDLIFNFVKANIRYCHALGASVVTDQVDIAHAHIEFDNNAAITHIRPGSGEEQCPVPGMMMEQQSFAAADALADEISSFVDVVARRGEPEVSGRMGRDALKVAVDITGQINEAMDRVRGAG